MGIRMRLFVCLVLIYFAVWLIKSMILWLVSNKISGILMFSCGVNLPNTKSGLSGWFCKKSVPVPSLSLGKSEVPRLSMMDFRPLFPP